MKYTLLSILIFLVIIGLLSFGSCKEKGNGEHPLQIGLEGKWNLESYRCCDWPAEIFDKDKIVWNFDMNNKIINVSNYIAFKGNLQYSYTFKEDGNYEFNIVGEQIIINYQDLQLTYDFDISNNILSLSRSPESDGPLFKFVR